MRKRLYEAGRKAALPEVEKLLTLWINELKVENLPQIVATLK